MQRILLLCFTVLHLLCAPHPVMSSENIDNSNDEQREVKKLITMTKEVREKKKLFAQHMNETKKLIKDFATKHYERLQVEETALRNLEIKLRAEVKVVVKNRRLNMKNIEARAKEIQRRRLEKNDQDDQDDDIMMNRNDANNFLQPHNRELWGVVGEAASSVVDTVVDTASSAVDTVSDVASSAWDAATDFASTLVGAAADAFEWLDKLADVISSSISGVWDFVKGIFNNLSDILNKIGELVAGFLGDAWSWIIKVFNWFKDTGGKIYEFLRFIFGKHCRGSSLCEFIQDEQQCKAQLLVDGECRDTPGQDSNGECGNYHR